MPVLSGFRASPSPHGGTLRSLSKQIAVEVASCHPKLLEAALAVTPEQLLKVRGWQSLLERPHAVVPRWCSQSISAKALTPLLQDRQHIQDLAAEILAEYDAGRIDAAEAQRRFFPATAFYSLLMSMLMSHKPEVALALMSTTRLPGESEAEEAARCRRIVVSSMEQRSHRDARLCPDKQHAPCSADCAKHQLNAGPVLRRGAAGGGAQQGAAAGFSPSVCRTSGSHAAAGH